MWRLRNIYYKVLIKKWVSLNNFILICPPAFALKKEKNFLKVLNDQNELHFKFPNFAKIYTGNVNTYQIGQ